jgi:hypothetical protein
MEQIIKSDPTLNYFINEAKLDIFNSFQVDLRINSIKIALFRHIDDQFNQLQIKWLKL